VPLWSGSCPVHHPLSVLAAVSCAGGEPTTIISVPTAGIGRFFGKNFVVVE
jgi:hypothetical protein